MGAPIRDFIDKYIAEGKVRMHMPGHKGKSASEMRDITEVAGADSLYSADGIIKESEAYAGEIYGARTFYSTEGSSLAIRAMLYLALIHSKTNSRTVIASRCAHKSFISAAALLDLNVEWVHNDKNYLSAPISADELRGRLDSCIEPPMAVYVTSPDYLGILTDISALASVCHEYGVLLLVDNAHGAYRKFLSPSRHPIDCGADMSTDSAHKTLPVLTGGAYLHIQRKHADMASGAKDALSLFGSTSPSYNILESLDVANDYLTGEFTADLSIIVDKIGELKEKLSNRGYTLVGEEEAKITIAAKPYGYLGTELADIVRHGGIEPEFADPDYIVFMPSASSDTVDLERLYNVLLNIEKRPEILTRPPMFTLPKAKMSIREATMARCERVPIKEAVGRILAVANVSCPPAIPILVPGEVVTEKSLLAFDYYGIDEISVVSE